MLKPVVTRTAALTLLCAGLAACGTDSISMSSEVGGGGTRSGYATNQSASAASPASSSSGSIAGDPVPVDGLGVTGEDGVLDNLLGSDPIGGTLEGALPQLADILGTKPDATTSGIVPEVAGALAGSGDGIIVPGGLGITGEGGVLADVLGSDVGGDLLGDQGLIAANIAGGKDGLLASVLGDNPTKGLLSPATNNLPLNQLTVALAGQPSLGVTGQSGLVADLLGSDLTAGVLPSGGAIGGLLGGGDTGALGHALPDGQAPLAAVGTTVSGLLGVVAGSSPSPVGGGVASVSDALGSVPVIGDVLGSVAGQAGAGLPSGDPISSVTNALAPVTSGASAGAPTSGAGVASQINGALSPVTDAVSSLPVVGATVGGLLNGVLGAGK